MKSILFSLLPVGAGILAAIIAAFRKPGGKTRSVTQHLAAGVVFAAVAVELIPDLMQRSMLWPTAIGFAACVGLFLILRSFDSGSKQNEEEKGISKSYALAIVLDIFIDGLVLGIGFTAGQNQGKLLTLALALELASLGMALVGEALSTGISRLKAVLLTSGACLSLVVGATSGVLILSRLPPPVFTGALAFGVAALLYLAAEELLREAHEELETRSAIILFFAGFLTVLLLAIGQKV